MTISRRTALKLGLGAGAATLLDAIPSALDAAEPSHTTSPRIARSAGARMPVLAARSLPLHDVRLTGGPLKAAQDADATYLLELEPDRMLAFYRQVAGLAPKAEGYEGWDGGGRNLTGHIAGHYLSAVSAMWAATGDRRFRDRADYIVSELKIVQDRHGDGYLSALAGGRRCFGALARGEIKAAPFDLNGEWSPWYTLHKTFAGLRDAYRYTGNSSALDVEASFAGWAEGILSSLDHAQLQHMMNTEFGGMNEVLVDLYADTGNPRWLTQSYAFEHAAFVEPLQRHQDDLAGVHANTAIPKLIGSAERYAYTQRPADLMAASFFYDRVTQHHSFASGGHGTDEYLGPPDRIGARVAGRTAESCNVYNMLKLSRRLFSIAPDVHFADFHERAQFNHALASFDTDRRRMCYMVPVGPGTTHEYQDMFRSFTCCVGTGMETHALAGEGLYYESGDTLWVNLYAPSTATWAGAGARLRMDSTFPEGETATLTLAVDAPKEFTLALRRPYWTGDGFTIRVNGKPVEMPDAVTQSPSGERVAPRRSMARSPMPVSSYVDVRRTWQSGDVVEVTLPRSLRLEPTPDMPRKVAVMWGPLLLAGDLGPEPRRGPNRGEDGELLEEAVADRAAVVPIFVVAADAPVSEWLVPVPGAPATFRTTGVGREPDAVGAAHDVQLVPFHRLHGRTYSTYWDLATPAEWGTMKEEYGREAARQRTQELATVAYMQPDAPSEKSFGYQAAPDATLHRMNGRSGRASRSWFSYVLPVEATHPMSIVATYYTADRRTAPASFDILVDGRRIAEVHVERSDPGRFYDVTYPVPSTLVQGKSSVTVRFQAAPGSQVTAVYGVRMLRADSP